MLMEVNSNDAEW